MIEETAREDLGYRLHTGANDLKFPKVKEPLAPGQKAEAWRLCRVRFTKGDMAGDVKKIAWEYAEPLIKSRRCEFIEWVR